MTPRKAYEDHRHHSNERGIEFLISYADWLEMWLASGKWGQRGRKSGQFVMCRVGDAGPYSKRNCYIGTVEQNQRDRWNDREKITNVKALKMIELYNTTEMTQAEIGKMFDVNPSYVSRIVNKKRKKNAN